ncbi:MAG: glycerol-3-phosphate dehydrogenase/oxidase, partial [Chloroflexi bacterium]|nr:glycerol-3-phosphate dehydrogenase/oxidase [Chloroflexota bacterium]
MARDAARRGLKVALVEMGDFGHGTSAKSTHLIHGGLRYLKQYDFGLVRQDLKEREILLKIAPHLVRPLPFIIPVYRRSAVQHLALRTGMALYDALAWGKSLPKHRWLSLQQTVALEPGLQPDGLQGSFRYFDARVSSVERLCLENILAAQEHGAIAINYARAEAVRRRNGKISGLEVADTLNEDRALLQARVVIAATGPWLDSTLAKLGRQGAPLLRRTKGIHLVTSQATKRALVLFAPDGRLFFTVPCNGLSLVGTTDTDFQGDPETAAASARDVRYLLDGVQPFLPAGPWNQIHYTTAGVRALVRVDGVPPSSVTRGHQVVDHERRDGLPGLISVVGGKITAYRCIAQEVVDLASGRLGKNRASNTDREALPGARFDGWAECIRETMAFGRRLGLEEDQSRNLVDTYGLRAREVFAIVEREPRLGERICAGAPDILAQVRFAAEKEMALTAEDFMLRRSLLGHTATRGVEGLGIVAGEMGQALGWTEA